MTHHSFQAPARDSHEYGSDARVLAVIEEAGELWADAGRVSYVPDDVNDWLELGLAELGWSKQRVDLMRERLLADARVARDAARQRAAAGRIQASRAAADTPKTSKPARSRDEVRGRIAELRAAAEPRKAAAAYAAAARERREAELAAARETELQRQVGEADAAAAVRAREIREARVREQREAERAAAARAAAEREAQETLERWRNRPAPEPGRLPYGVSHSGAEQLAADWMRHLGVLDAEVTRASGDGGIDVVSDGFVAQVKNYAGSVSVQEVRELYGVATAEGKRALVFTSGKLTAEATAFAARVGIGVLRYDAVAGMLIGLNDIGKRAVKFSIPEAWD